MKSIILFLALLTTQLALAASCPPPNFTSNEQVNITSPTLLIVTHPATIWDYLFSSKAGVDASVQYAKKNGYQVVYLHGQSFNESYFFADCNPNYWVASRGGEFNFAVPAERVISVGGHWEYCQESTVRDLFKKWQEQPIKARELTLVMDGTYSSGYHFKQTDSYYSDFKRFTEIISFGHGRRWKLNLLESVAIINDELKAQEFLKRQKYNYSLLQNKYNVDLAINGRVVEQLFVSSNPEAGRLTINYINSLYSPGPGATIPAFLPQMNE